MTGDQNDMAARIRAVLPTGWFPDTTPVLDSVLAGLAWMWSWAYALLQFVAAQTRLATTSGMWLDLFAFDYFGNRVTRGTQETDDAFRSRVGKEMQRIRGTRAAVVSVLTDLTGQAPTIFEPMNTGDTGGWGTLGEQGSGLAWNTAGGWGSLAMPFQCFVTAYNPPNVGIANVQPWNGEGGWGSPVLAYADLQQSADTLTDAEIYAAVADVMPCATIARTQIAV